MAAEWYLDFVDLKHRPRADELLALFRVGPASGVSIREAAGRVASESSIGTWTKLTTLKPHMRRLMAHVYEIKGSWVKVAYPLELFEEGSVPGLASAIAGNIFGMKALKNLRLVDVQLPRKYLRNFKGPLFGRQVIKKIFRRKSGPITAVVPKPKVGFTPQEHAAEIGYALWRGGIDCVKDDENLTSQRFNRFERRVKLLAKFRDKAERETGEVKDAFINVTAPNLRELERRVKLVHEHGFRYFMIDVVVSGFTAVQTATDLARDYGMAIHGHRAMHAAFTRNPRHGISMLCLAKLMRVMGVDQLHIGTVIGKLAGAKREVLAIKELITQQEVEEIPGLRMPQRWGEIKPMLPVASGGLHPGILPEVFDIYGTTDLVIQVGGGTLGHPMGAQAGARAVVQAIEAYKAGVSLEEYAKTHQELRAALKHWGRTKPV